MFSSIRGSLITKDLRKPRREKKEKKEKKREEKKGGKKREIYLKSFRFFFGKFYPSTGGGVGGIYAPKDPLKGDTPGSLLYNVTRMLVLAPTTLKRAQNGQKRGVK